MSNVMMGSYQLTAFLKKWGHHSRSGGYHRLADFLNPDVRIVSESKGRRGGLSRRVLYKLMPGTRGVNLYNWGYLTAELNVLKQMRRFPNGIVHAFYTEDQLYLLLKQKQRLKGALVGSLHLPANSPWYARALKYGSLENLGRLDAAIVVSRSMIADYEQWIEKDKIFFIPHGIDTSIFKPKKMEEIIPDNKPVQILVVGGYGRDWDTVAHTVSELKAREVDFKVTAVVPESVRKKLDRIPEFNLLSGISEQDLISLYRYSDVVLMPVIHATANNALLEAIACGTPVISTRIGGIPDYLDDTCGWLFPTGDVRSIVSVIEEVAQNRDQAIEKGENARKKSLSYDWTSVADEVKAVYQFVLDRIPGNSV